MRRILRTTARGQPISHLIHRVAVFAVAFLFVIPFTAQANTTNSANTASTIPPSETDEDDESEPAVKFLKDIAPILDKHGCSAGMCHGKFGGQGGLNLSLLTLNPESDYEPIVHHSRGRRINLLEPDQRLFFLKSTGQIAHE